MDRSNVHFVCKLSEARINNLMEQNQQGEEEIEEKIPWTEKLWAIAIIIFAVVGLFTLMASILGFTESPEPNVCIGHEGTTVEVRD